MDPLPTPTAPGDDAICTFLLKRKKRRCAQASLPGRGLCSNHTPEGLAALRRQTTIDRAAAEARVAAEAAAGEGGAESKAGGAKRRHKRISSNQKRMVNPFSFRDLAAPIPEGAFADPSRPVHLDIGCARGKFVLKLAEERPDEYNYCGVEIRTFLVDEANATVEKRLAHHARIGGGGGDGGGEGEGDAGGGCGGGSEGVGATGSGSGRGSGGGDGDGGGGDSSSSSGGGAGESGTEAVATPELAAPQRNLYYVACNINVPGAVTSIVSTLPPFSLRTVSIQFPDPWKRKRHVRRRIVQPSLVRELAAVMPEGGCVHVSSDRNDVAVEMTTHFSEGGWFDVQMAPGPDLAPVVAKEGKEGKEGRGGEIRSQWRKATASVVAMAVAAV